jgi:hypothetical protein
MLKRWNVDEPARKRKRVLAACDPDVPAWSALTPNTSCGLPFWGP